MDHQTNELLAMLSHGYSQILKNQLVGIYLHGSYALGSYLHSVSDLDYLVIVNKKLDAEDKKRLMNFTLKELVPLAPKKGLEFHVLVLKDTRSPVFPLSFDFHFSNMHHDWYLQDPNEYIFHMQGVDQDLAAHLQVVKKHGIVLCGEPIDEVFGSLPVEVYFESILEDVAAAEEEIGSDPMYLVLNLCRMLVYKKEKRILSKKDGGEWGVHNLPPEYRGLIMLALSEYCGGQPRLETYRKYDLKSFAKEMLWAIKE